MMLKFIKTVGLASVLTFASVSMAQAADIKPGMSQDAVKSKLGNPVSIEVRQGEECSWNPGVAGLVQHWIYKNGKVVMCDGKVDSVQLK